MTDARRRILDASIELVNEQGVRGVSFREVARRAGVSHQTPYHHFGNHLGILREIAREGFALLLDAMRGAAGAHDDPMDALHASGIAYVRFAREHTAHFRVMFQRDLVDVRDPEAPIVEAEATSELLGRLAASARGAGYGAGLDDDAIAKVCWSCVHGISVLTVESVIEDELNGDDGTSVSSQVVASLSALLGRG